MLCHCLGYRMSRNHYHCRLLPGAKYDASSWNVAFYDSFTLLRFRRSLSCLWDLHIQVFNIGRNQYWWIYHDSIIALTSYLSDTSTNEWKTLKFVLTECAMMVGYPIGLLASGQELLHLGYTWVFVTSMSLGALCVVYREVQLDFTPEMEIFYMLFDRCHTKSTLIN